VTGPIFTLKAEGELAFWLYYAITLHLSKKLLKTTTQGLSIEVKRRRILGLTSFDHVTAIDKSQTRM